MKPKPAITALLILGLILFLWQRSRVETTDPPPPPTPAQTPDPEPTPPEPFPAPGTPLGDQFLENYADPSTPASLDLEKVGRVVEGLQTLMKNLDTRLIAENSLLADFLRGNNREGLIYVSKDSPLFGPDGSLQDRWGSPLIIHPLGTGIIELRSAGPDKKPYTEDDLIRDPRGGVRHGSDPPQPGGPGPQP